VKNLSVINKIAGAILMGFGVALVWDVLFFFHPPR